LRAEQVRQTRAPSRLKLTISAITVAVALIGSLGAGTIWLLHLLGHLP
jgi:hypothetical protein